MNSARRRLSLSLTLVLLVAPLISGTSPRSTLEVRARRPVTPPPHYLEVRSFLESRRAWFVDGEIKRLTRTILDESLRAQIEPRLILGLIHVESSGNPRAVSQVGALGLMQLRPKTAAAMAQELAIPWEGSESLFDPDLNVRLGVYYLTQLIDRFGDLDTALAAYNWGPTRIARAIRKGRTVPVRYTESVRRAYTALI